MLVVALDSTTRLGSHALVRDDTVLAVGAGDTERAHAERLPGEVLALLAAHGLTVRDVNLFAVAAGPGSFTGLRIGIASMQGLAFAVNRPIVGVSALDALARAVVHQCPPGPSHVAVWMDGQRGEVFAALYAVHADHPAVGRLVIEDTAFVGTPEEVAARWLARGVADAMFVGEGALRYRTVLEAAAGLSAGILDPVPPTAPQVAALAVERVRRGGTFHPHAIVPIYVRRPDVELARERRAKQP